MRAFVKLLQPLAVRWFVLQISCCWPHLREFGRGEPSALDPLIDMFAHRIVAAAQANGADEIVVIGHSAGGVFALAVMARALDLDPGLGRCGPGLVLLTLGSIMPALALHPGAARLRVLVQRIISESSVVWIDCQSRTDWLNFVDFDVVAGLGLHAGPDQRNPIKWHVRLRDMLTPESFARLRGNLFRRHYQFIMGNDKVAPYDYLMLNCSPFPVETWCTRGWDIAASFAKHVSYLAQDSRGSSTRPSSVLAAIPGKCSES